MLAAAARGCVNIVSSLLATGTDPNYCEENGDPALLTALQYGHLQVVDLLLQEGADVNQEGESARSALHKAVLLGRPDYVEHLLQKNASPEIRDFQGRTPLLLAVEKRQTDCVRVLAQLGADINVATKVFRMTPLILAAERGYSDIVQILLNHKALLNQRDMRGFTALHAAVLSSVVKTVEMLLAAGADPNVLDDDGMSALMFSVYRNRPLIAKLLIQHNCDIDVSGDLRFLAHLSDEPVRFTAIQLAVAFRRRETAAILLQAGCNNNNIHEFLQLRLPYVTPDRTRSMLRCTQKVRRTSPDNRGNQNVNSSGTTVQQREDEAWLRLLYQHVYTPPTLANRARTVIRDNLPHLNFHQNLRRLPLPRPLQEYVMMTEF